jgi:hypothetical protein
MQMANSIVLLSENPSIEPIILKSSDFSNGRVAILGVGTVCDYKEAGKGNIALH